MGAAHRTTCLWPRSTPCWLVVGWFGFLVVAFAVASGAISLLLSLVLASCLLGGAVASLFGELTCSVPLMRGSPLAKTTRACLFKLNANT